MSSLCRLLFYGNEFIAQLFGLPLELHFQSFLSVSVSGGPDGFVIFDLVFDYGVKNHRDLVCCCRGGGPRAELGFHSAQIVAQGCWAMMEGKGCQAKEMAGAVFHRSGGKGLSTGSVRGSNLGSIF